jgi:hypothetical protein
MLLRIILPNNRIYSISVSLNMKRNITIFFAQSEVMLILFECHRSSQCFLILFTKACARWWSDVITNTWILSTGGICGEAGKRAAARERTSWVARLSESKRSDTASVLFFSVNNLKVKH